MACIMRTSSHCKQESSVALQWLFAQCFDTLIMAWQGTIAALQPLLPSGKPKLTEELLARPPFRFLKDIVDEVQRSTGFAQGLFPAELNAREMDKEAKVAYLQQLVDIIEAVLGQEVKARPSKIVAGLEPEATNMMLQMLAAAALRGDSTAAVQSVLKRRAAGAAAKADRADVGRSGAASGQALDQTASALRADLLAGSEGSREDETPVVFSRVENLLPALARKVDEARQVLTGSGAAPGSGEALAQCNRVQAIAQDAAVLAKCLEALQGAAHIMVAESAAWGKEADKAAGRLQQEQRAEAEAAAAGQQAVARLEAEVAAVRKRIQQATLAAGRKH